MSGISTAIQVQDKVSGSLNRITAALYNTTSAFHGVDKASETTFNTSGVQAMTQELYAYEARIEQIESELVDANRRLEQMERETEENTNAANRLQSAFSSIGGIVAGLGIGMLVKQQVGSAIDYASDLTEVQNVVDTVFGESSKSVDAWAKTTLNAFGLNELSAKQFAGTMGAMLSSSGLESEAQEMSISLAELAGDMASFYNLDAEEAFNKIRSGISGETEPLKQLGINMSVANLEAYALSQGIETAYSEMSQAEQTMLRYNYLMSTTANAQGDFARTSDSYANQVKLLKENWTAFTGELATNALPILAQGIGLLNEGVSFISENWTVIQPILLGLLAIIGAYTTALIAYNAIKMGVAIVEGIHAAATAMSTGATFAATAAQYGFNAALLACPITWIIILIIALIAIIVALATWIAKTADVANSAFGVIAGAVAVAGAAIWNTVLGLINGIIQFAWTNFVEPWIGIIEWILNVMNGGFDSFGEAVQSLLGNVISWFLSLGKVVTKIIDAIFGTDWTSGLNSLQNEVLGWGKNENAITLDRTAPTLGDLGVDRIEYGDAWSAGAEWGDGVAEKFSGLTASIDTSNIDSAYTGTDAGSVADSLAGIKSDTSEIKDSVDITDENLKYMRDIAERDVINRFTTAEIKVDMQNTNNISSGMDIDGVVEQLTAGVQEAMAQAAEGVHS